MELFADRFVVLENAHGACAIDLATGDRVTVRTSSAGEAGEELRWAARCDTLRQVRHRALAALLDYGATGESQRFEAWACGARWSGARSEAVRAFDLASRWLRNCNLTPPLSLDDVHGSPRGAVVVPDAQSGYPLETPTAGADAIALGERGIALVDRPSITSLSELFTECRDPRPHIVGLWGPKGSGRTTEVLKLARIARLHGFVPVAVRLLDGRVDPALRADALAECVRGRSLFLIDDGHESPFEGWTVLVETSIRSPRSHVLLFTREEELPCVQGIVLRPLAADMLAAAIHPGAANASDTRRVRGFAEQSKGLPGRFERLLWPDVIAPAGTSKIRAAMAAERPAIYEVDGTEPSSVAASAEPRSWPAPGELAALRRRLDAAVKLLSAGRHIPGTRGLRQAIGGLARRDDWVHAGQGAIALASSSLDRGRPREALTTLDEAREYVRRAAQEPLVLDVALLAGRAWTDLGRFDEAESVLASAAAAADATADIRRTSAARLGLARCAFWRGRYDDARETIERLPEEPLDDRFRIQVDCLASAAAIGSGIVDVALTRASAALARARAQGNSAWIAEASWSVAFAHLTAGDLEAVHREVSMCLAAARAAHDPLRAIRARLLSAECLRRQERATLAEALLRRVAKLSATHLPPIVRAHAELLRALLAQPSSQETVLQAHVSRCGLAALALFVPSRARTLPGVLGRDKDDRGMHDLVHILRLCQTAEEESTLLQQVCEHVREQLHAAAAGFFAASNQVLASAGGRLDDAIAERAIAAGVVIAPHRNGDRVEAAAPVGYGGRNIGVLGVRWPLGSPHDVSRDGAVLTLAATAAAPLVWAALVRRTQTSGTGAIELRGISAAMADVRQAVERAAPAPFSVLIEGESGSGKELVARALHRCGSRRDRMFSTLNCAALPDDLVEAELFGHARGAFTGAVGERAGVFEEAHNGTLFLDEIGELSARAQAKVLRVVQEGELRRVGENTPRRIDVRIVAATNRDLRAEAAAGRFRLDLLYRLDVIRIVVPPLRDRPDDIAVLVEHFWREAAARVGCRATLAAATVASLARYHWPGNVRELQNVLAALAVRCPKRGVVPPTALPPQFESKRQLDTARLDDARRIFEERFVRAALVRTGGRRSLAAAELGVTRQGLTKLMTRLGIAQR